MDKVSVSASGLRDAYLALQSFQERTQLMTAAFEKLLQTCSDNLGETFRQDLANYVEELKTWNGKVSHYSEENYSAILERMRALADYCSTTYEKRIF